MSQAKNFSNQPLDMVTSYVGTGCAARYDDSQARTASTVRHAMDSKVDTLPATSRLERSFERCGVRKPCRLGKLRPAPAVRLQTASRARPLARRALMTARPLRVFMRTRKPWVRLRRVTDG